MRPLCPYWLQCHVTAVIINGSWCQWVSWWPTSQQSTLSLSRWLPPRLDLPRSPSLSLPLPAWKHIPSTFSQIFISIRAGYRKSILFLVPTKMRLRRLFSRLSVGCLESEYCSFYTSFYFIWAKFLFCYLHLDNIWNLKDRLLWEQREVSWGNISACIITTDIIQALILKSFSWCKPLINMQNTETHPQLCIFHSVFSLAHTAFVMSQLLSLAHVLCLSSPSVDPCLSLLFLQPLHHSFTLSPRLLPIWTSCLVLSPSLLLSEQLRF